MRIEKFRVPADGQEHQIELAKFAQIYTVGWVPGGVVFWAEAGNVKREFCIFRTGEDAAPGWHHTGTALCTCPTQPPGMPGEAMHLFERMK